MGLSTCAECGGQISSAAKSCPHCGASKRSKARTLIIGLGALAVFSAAVAAMLPQNNDEPAAAVSNDGEPLLVTLEMPEVVSGQSLEGITNLPDGMELVASLQPPVPGCRPNCSYAWQQTITVRNGKFSTGPLSVPPGDYTLEITSPLPSSEPSSVQAVIGTEAEKLSGPLVKELAPGLGPGVDYEARVTVPPNAVRSLLAKEDDLNDECKDGAESATTEKICGQRDALVGELEAKGWCWGPQELPAYEQHWQRCATSSGTEGDGQTGDPYAASQNAIAVREYTNARNDFLADVRTLYFAVGCKVFANESAILPLLASKTRALQFEGQANRIMVDQYLDMLTYKAAQEGMARSSVAGACQYWQSNPNAVYELRREAQAAIP